VKCFIDCRVFVGFQQTSLSSKIIHGEQKQKSYNISSVNVHRRSIDTRCPSPKNSFLACLFLFVVLNDIEILVLVLVKIG